jgi:hypothetical protein
MGEVTMRQSKLIATLGLSLSAFALASPSFAQTARAQADGSFYEFDDDDMLGDTISSNTAILRIRPIAAKVSLIRPRASFVAEMLESVEVL